MGAYNDNSVKDITTSVTWDSNNTAVAIISNKAGSQGLGNAVFPGSATITATYSKTDVKGSTTLTVTSANQVPIAKIAANPLSGAAPVMIHFDGSGSYDPDGTLVSYAWNFGDGTGGTGPAIDHNYTTPGSYQVVLTVTDHQGGQGSDQATIKVNTAVNNVLFNDNFSRTTGLGSNWKVYTGGFTTDGANAVSSGIANFAGITPSLRTNDYSTEAILTIPTDSLYSGIIARGNIGTGFRADLYSAQIATNGTLNLYRRNAGTWTFLKGASVGIVAGRSYRLKLKVSGTNPVTLEISLDEKIKFSYNDSSSSRILDGIPGIENYNSGVKYDQFTITTP